MSRLAKNIIFNIFGQLALMVLGFVAVKYVFRQLGEEALGIIYFTAVLHAVLGPLLDLGIGSTTVREVSAHSSDDPSYIRELLQTSSLFFWCAYGVLAVGIYASGPWLVERWINLQTLDPETATYVLRVLGIGAMLTLPRGFYASALRGLQRMEFPNLIDVATSALQQFGTIVIILLGGRLIHVAYWFAACFALGIVAYLLITAHFFSVRALTPGVSLSVIKRNFHYASRAASISVLGMIHTQADKAVVSKLLPLGAFGYYGVAAGAVARGALVTSAVSQAAFPNLSALFKAGDRARLLAQYRKLHDLLCYGMVPLFAAVPFAALPLFGYVLDAEAARDLLLPVTLLCVGHYMNATLNIPYVFSMAVGKPEIAARANLYALFAVLPATYLLVRYFGLNGAGFSWVFYHLFLYACQVPRTCRECLGISAGKWYVDILRIALLVTLTYCLAGVILFYSGRLSVFAHVLAYASATVIFLAGAYVSVGSELREVFDRLPQALKARIAEGA